MASLATSSELGRAEASSSLQLLGASSPKIDAAAPSAGQYNVEKYVELKQAIATITKLLGDKDTNIAPEPLAVIRADDLLKTETLEGSGSVWALSAITKGKSCLWAKSEYEKKHGSRDASSLQTILSGIETTYRNLAQSCDAAVPPPRVVQEAKEYLGALKVKL